MSYKCPHCADLTEQNRLLAEQLAATEDRVRWFTTHQTLARGIAGERLVATASGGELTPHTSSVDLVFPAGTRVEVKAAGLSPDSKSTNLKWQWGKVFGEKNTKVYDMLLLIGEADPRFMELYAYPGKQILFLIPFDEVMAMTATHSRGARGISLTSNPVTARGRAAGLYARYQVAADQLNAMLK